MANATVSTKMIDAALIRRMAVPSLIDRTMDRQRICHGDEQICSEDRAAALSGFTEAVNAYVRWKIGTLNGLLVFQVRETKVDRTLALIRPSPPRHGSLGAGGRVGGSNAVFYRFDIGGDRSASFRHDGSPRLNVTPSVAWRISNGSRLEARYSFDRNRMSGDSGIPLVPLVGDSRPIPRVR
jgi:hypothetical protein